MKTRDEWIRDIHEKADKRLTEQKRRRKVMAGISSLAVCLALALCSVFTVPGLIGNNGLTAIVLESSSTNQTLDSAHSNRTNNSAHSDNPIITPPSSEVNSSASNVYTPSTPSTSNPPIPPVEKPNNDNDTKRLFAANIIINQISAKPKYRDPTEHHKDFWTEAKITEYLGVDLTALSLIPADLTYVPKGDFRILFHNSGEIAEDYQSFIYKGNNRKVEVLVSKISAPYDCIYKLEIDRETPVGDTEAVFGVQPNSKDHSKYDFCYADFASGGLYYRVKADKLTPLEFYKIVEEITKLK